MIPLILCYIAALAGSLFFLMYHINLWKYPVFYSAPLILAVFLPVSVTILLPLDYISHNLGSVGGFQMSDEAFLLMWKGTYWTTFLLTWLVLPVLQEFYGDGNFSKMSKLKASLRRNARFQVIILLCSAACIIYLVLEVGLTFKNLKSMLIALSHIYALVLALWLMGHGMIAIPKNLWIQGNLLQDLNHSLLRIPSLVESLEDTKSDFKEDILQVIILKENFTDATTLGQFSYRDWILSLHNQIPEDLKDIVRRQFAYSESRNISREQVTESFMSTLTHKFQTHHYKLHAYSSEYETILMRVERLQKLLDARCSGSWHERQEILKNLNSPLSGRVGFYIQCFVLPALARVQSLLVFAISFVIIESELFHSTNLSLVNIIIYKVKLSNYNLGQAILLAFIFGFMLFCSVNSLAKLKVFNMYNLVPRNSDPVSACFYGSQIARMTVPLSYNVVTLFLSRKSTFEEWYGQSIHLAGFFNLMNNWIPRLLLVPIILAAFNLYDKIKARIGLSSDFYGWTDNYEADLDVDSLNQGQALGNKRDLLIAEAKRLVAMELNRRASRISFSTRLRSHETEAMRLESRPTIAENSTFNDSQSLNNAPNVDTEIGSGSSSPTFWTRLYSGLKNAVNTRSRRDISDSDSSLRYRDYDNDADEHLVL